MGLPQYYAMCRQWRRNPPTHLLVAWFLEYKPPPEASLPSTPVPELPGAPPMNEMEWEMAAMMNLSPNGFVRADQL